MSSRDVLDFVARALESGGAVVEAPGERRLEALLPDELARSLGLDGDHAILTDGGIGIPCGYGSDVLSRVARAAIGGGRAAVFDSGLAPCAPREASGIDGINVALRVIETRPAPGWVIAGAARYAARADDERLGLVRSAVAAPCGVRVALPDLSSSALSLTPLSAKELRREDMEAALPALVSSLRRAAAVEVADFRDSTARRRARDALRLERYFADMDRDLRRRLRRRESAALQGKLDAIPAELQARLSQLEENAVVRLRLDLVALAAIRAPGVTCELEVRHRKERSTLRVRYEAISREWTGFLCAGCGGSTRVFALCDALRHVLCAECWEACGTGGHRPCFRCGGEPQRQPWLSGPKVSTEPATAAGAPQRGAEPPATDSAPRAESVARGALAPPDAATVLALLERYRVPLTSAEIRREIPADPDTLRAVLQDLAEKGLVGRLGERRGTRYFSKGSGRG